MTEKLKLGQAALRRRMSENLKRLRAARKISQEELGDLAGLHRTYVSQVERMVTNVSLDNIYLLAEALAVDPVELLRQVEEEAELPVAEDVGKKKGRRPSSKI